MGQSSIYYYFVHGCTLAQVSARSDHHTLIFAEHNSGLVVELSNVLNKKKPFMSIAIRTVAHRRFAYGCTWEVC